MGYAPIPTFCSYPTQTPIPAVEVMRRVWVQQFWQDEGVVRWRSDQDIPPASILISSPYDPEAHREH